MESDDVLNAILKKLGNKYECIKHLGGGEFSIVYLIRHRVSGKEHALKILDYHFLQQRLKKENPADSKNKFNKIKKRFITEAKLYEKIDHPNIVKIHETGVVTDTKENIEIPYFIMTYIKGSSLAVVLKNEAPLEMSRVLRLSRHILTALDTIHQNNIIHRDLKPANIMIEKATDKAVIIDFGIAKDILSSTQMTTTGALLGSPMYMAPEQFVDASKVGPRIDIYSFGVVLFEMVTGEPPFKGTSFLEVMHAHRKKPVPSVRAKNPALPPAMDNIIFKSMAKDPNKRYKSAKDFLNALKKSHEKKFSQRPANYLIYLFAAVVIAAFLVIDPFSIMKGTNEKKAITSNEKPVDIEAIAAQQREKMKRDFDALETFLESSASNNEKINKCRKFLNGHRNVPETSETRLMVSEINRLMAGMETDEEYRRCIRSVNEFMERNDYHNASLQLQKAKKIKDSDEVRELAKTIKEKSTQWNDYNTAKEKINLNKYLEFKGKYPHSLYLSALKRKLKAVDKALPPEKYWHKPIGKNKNGYYQLTFGAEHNNHTMIYIPGKRSWIDTYEVSNGQFRKFLKDLNQSQMGEIPDRKSSKLIHEGDEFPAVVTYEMAEKYCKKYGFRLPRLEEWEYAAGKETSIYPWGNELPGKKGMWPANFDSLDDKRGIERDGFEGTAPVKSFESFASPFGVVNAAGNVWEWVQGRILKGGSFFSSPKDLMIKNSIAGRSKDTHGFRCVKDEN